MKTRFIMAAIASAALLVGCGGGEGAANIPISQTAGIPTQMVTLDVTEEVTEPSVEVLGSIAAGAHFLTPEQVRKQYGFDTLPNTPEAQGSGQLIAIVIAYDNPDLAENLATFSAKYKLPVCDTVNTVYAKLPSGYMGATVSHPKVGEKCTFQVINVDSFGRATATKPNGGKGVSAWAMEGTMDVQWAHAMAPQASIVVIQTPSNFVSAMGFAVKYASETAGANVVSMSWGAREDSIKCNRKPGTDIKYDLNCSDIETAKKFWVAHSEGKFSGKATLVAASGDIGVLQWPSIHPSIMAVGGTVINGTEYAWNGSGGGLSTSFNAPAWQPAVTYSTARAVPDVAYAAATPVAIYIKPNAATGFADATCVTNNGAANCGWYGGTGTSAGAPQWAGLVAVNNAMRASQGKAAINFVASLYTDIALFPDAYSTAFGDIITGGLTTNVAKLGYDTVTGLGVPNAGVLIDYLLVK